MTLPETKQALREIRERAGYGNFDRAVMALNRERVNPQRDKRQKFPPRKYQQLFDKQRGWCPICVERLLVPARRNAIDHIDPNRQDFNHTSNLQLLHPQCNLRKSSKSIQEQAKENGKTFREILKGSKE